MILLCDSCLQDFQFVFNVFSFANPQDPVGHFDTILDNV